MKRAILITLILILLALIFLVTKQFSPFDSHHGRSISERSGTQQNGSTDSITYDVVAIDSVAKEAWPSVLRLRASDVTTGISVIPDYIEVRQRENKEILYKFDQTAAFENKAILLPLQNGTYDITINADGYQTMSSYFIFNNDSLNINFNLEPLVPLQELSSDFIEKLHRDDSMVIIGFIVDDEIGIPIAGVSVYSEDKTAKSSSQKSGFFQLALPLPESQSEIEKRCKLFFEKSGYVTLVKTNFDVYTRGDMGLKVRMTKGEGIKVEKVLTHREADIELN